jgi:tRNA-uridine 2-sulfurtransferase
MDKKCIVLFSGGLDSVIAVHLLKQQGFEVIALNFVLPFDKRSQKGSAALSSSAEKLGTKLVVREDGADFVDMLKNPEFGFGKHANPCIDCRVRRLRKAAALMAESGASFIATGEVVGQRPMSQRRDTLYRIEKHSGLSGWLLRPLSAGLLNPTRVERDGLVDRSQLLSIQGRGRKEQLEYAKRFGLDYFQPAGGCLLTEATAAAKVADLRACHPAFSLSDVELLGIGRHFRLTPEFRLIVARDDAENEVIERQVTPSDYRFEMAGVLGPLGLGRGDTASPDTISQCCAIIARYCKARNDPAASVTVSRKNRSEVYTVVPAAPASCDALRIGAVRANP